MTYTDSDFVSLLTRLKKLERSYRELEIKHKDIMFHINDLEKDNKALKAKLSNNEKRK
jgi:hypothetical protein